MTNQGTHLDKQSLAEAQALIDQFPGRSDPHAVARFLAETRFGGMPAIFMLLRLRFRDPRVAEEVILQLNRFDPAEVRGYVRGHLELQNIFWETLELIEREDNFDPSKPRRGPLGGTFGELAMRFRGTSAPALAFLRPFELVFGQLHWLPIPEDCRPPLEELEAVLTGRSDPAAVEFTCPRPIWANGLPWARRGSRLPFGLLPYSPEAYLRARCGVSRAIAKQCVARHRELLHGARKWDHLPGNPRAMLMLEAALNVSPCLIYDTAGLDPSGAEAIDALVLELVGEGYAALQIEFPQARD